MVSLGTWYTLWISSRHLTWWSGAIYEIELILFNPHMIIVVFIVNMLLRYQYSPEQNNEMSSCLVHYFWSFECNWYCWQCCVVALCGFKTFGMNSDSATPMSKSFLSFERRSTCKLPYENFILSCNICYLLIKICLRNASSPLFLLNDVFSMQDDKRF